MTDQRTIIARRAAASAVSTRLKNGYSLTTAISPFDLALKLRIELRFQCLPSLEGMYSPNPIPAIVLGTDRPAARQIFTCAHEIGHHVFGHGTKVDQYIDFKEEQQSFDHEEFIAQSFAGFLLMPKVAVQNQLKKRMVELGRITPEEIYRIANYFGVGFQTFLSHLRHSLGLITRSQYQDLGNLTPKQIRPLIIGSQSTSPLVCADQFWDGLPIDLEVGDSLCVPKYSEFEGRALVANTSSSGVTLFHAVSPGIGRVLNHQHEWAAFVRVRPKNYTGRAIFRHIEADE